MTAEKIAEKTEIASPTVREVLTQFLIDQERRLSGKTYGRYREVIELLEQCLDGYGYDGLDDEEEALYDRFTSARGEEHREFCDIFGPEHIVPNLDEFLGYFMIRKVIGSRSLLRQAGTVTKKLTGWLVANGYAKADEVEDFAPAQRARNLAKVGALTEALHELPLAGIELPDDLEGHFDITRVERGRLWLRHLGGEIVEVELPVHVTELCQPGWTISGVVGRRGAAWELVEIWNVYP